MVHNDLWQVLDLLIFYILWICLDHFSEMVDSVFIETNPNYNTVAHRILPQFFKYLLNWWWCSFTVLIFIIWVFSPCVCVCVSLYVSVCSGCRGGHRVSCFIILWLILLMGSLIETRASLSAIRLWQTPCCWPLQLWGTRVCATTPSFLHLRWEFKPWFSGLCGKCS